METAEDLGLSPDSLRAKVMRRDYFVPETGEGAEILEGSSEEILDQLIDRLKVKGGIR